MNAKLLQGMVGVAGFVVVFGLVSCLAAVAAAPPSLTSSGSQIALNAHTLGEPHCAIKGLLCCETNYLYLCTSAGACKNAGGTWNPVSKVCS